MTKNYQLFKEIPSIEVVTELMKLYGIKDFDENYRFSKFDLEKINLIDNLNQYKPELDKYYLKCKSKKYTDNLTIKKSITILRHFLKPHDYKVISREKYNNRQKYLVYNLLSTKKLNDANLIVNFD